MADMPTVQAPGQEAPPPPAAAPQFDPVGEVRKRYPALKTWSDDQVVKNLSHPEKFRAAFPEYSHLDDATITRNMGKYAAPQPAQVRPAGGASGSWTPETLTEKASRFAQTPIIPPGRAEEEANDIAVSPPTLADADHPLLTGAKKGLAGAYRDTMQMVRGVSSPLGLATLGAGAATKLPGAAGAIAKLATRGAGAGFAVKGVKDVGENLPAAVHGDPDAAEKTLQGAAMVAGGAAGTQTGAGDPIVKPIGEAIGRKLAPQIGNATEAAGRAIQSVSGGPKRMAAIPPGSPVEGNLTRLEVAKYAEDKGIQLTPAQATGSRPLQTIQAIGERSLLKPGEDLQQHLEGQRQTFGNAVEDFKTRISPDVAGTEQVGGHLQQQAQQKVQALKDQAHADYAEFRDKTGDVPVDVTDIASKYSAKLDSMKEALANLPAQYASPIKQLLTKASEMGASTEALDTAKGMGYKSVAEMEEKLGPQVMDELKLKGAANQPRQIPMDTAQQLRSAFLDMSRDYSGNVPKRLQTMAGELAKDLDGTMQKSATDAGAAAPWRKANATWKQLQEVYNDTQSPLYRVLKESDPVKVPDKVLEVGQNGGSPRNLRLLRGEGFDLNPLKREVIDRIHNQNFNVAGGGAQARMGGYSLPFLKELFEPAELAEIQKLSRVGRAIKYESNPSGTSNVLMGEGQLHGFISKGAAKTVGIPAAAAKLSLSPRFFHGATGMPRVSPP